MAPGMHPCMEQPDQLHSVHTTYYPSIPISLSPCMLLTFVSPLLTHMLQLSQHTSLTKYKLKNKIIENTNLSLF